LRFCALRAQNRKQQEHKVPLLTKPPITGLELLCDRNNPFLRYFWEIIRFKEEFSIFRLKWQKTADSEIAASSNNHIEFERNIQAINQRLCIRMWSVAAFYYFLV